MAATTGNITLTFLPVASGITFAAVSPLPAAPVPIGTAVLGPAQQSV